MKTEAIEKLKRREADAKGNLGFLTGVLSINLKGSSLLLDDRFTTSGIDTFLRKALLEKETEIINRALELEREYFGTIEKEAKIEAASLLIGFNLKEDELR